MQMYFFMMTTMTSIHWNRRSGHEKVIIKYSVMVQFCVKCADVY